MIEFLQKFVAGMAPDGAWVHIAWEPTRNSRDWGRMQIVAVDSVGIVGQRARQPHGKYVLDEFMTLIPWNRVFELSIIEDPFKTEKAKKIPGDA